MSGKSSKVIQFPIATQKKIACQSMSGITIGQLPSRKENNYIYSLLGGCFGAALMIGLFWSAGLAIAR
jgi:hypothetical protein